MLVLAKKYNLWWYTWDQETTTIAFSNGNQEQVWIACAYNKLTEEIGGVAKWL